MTSTTIEASYLLTPQEWVKFAEAQKRGFGRTVGELIYSCLAACLVLGMVRVFYPPNDTIIYALIPALTLVFFLYWNFGGRRHDLKQKCKRMLQAQGLLDQKVVWVVDDAHLQVITAGSEASWTWEVVTKAVESREGFMIYVHALCQWLPCHAFRHDEDRDRFKEIVAANVAHFVTLK